ncbi:hypothetical protein [Kitasatospora purpeofusca]|uniref:hypothetical protein n=1 Tax=Kitasatospora purpeofusca TaxID=67352 RepID=UPI0022509BA1|nr:hypothetical protein [Kitasatospora purpeofusca]MCX4752383.1 hypothetical protein [Kitasatospora purpeofusca]WSR31959.1 hypothetical protein OG715_13800 [Kitasatospora purpeofusca]WSR39986.1 hypothetical protein OG196_13275 [Kitasatospora purpeofusca]
MTSAPANPPPEHRPGLRSTDLPARRSEGPATGRRRRPAVRSAALAAGAVLLLGTGLAACKGGVSLCLDDNSCDVAVHTEKADSTHTVEVFGGDRTVTLTVGRITDTTAEVKLGEETKTLTEDIETGVGSAKITLRHANAREHTAELHVVR